MTAARDPFRDQQVLLSERQVTKILDVGANVGDTTAAYRSVFPEAVIHGFEPFPASFEQYRQRFVSDRLVRPVQSAVSREPGTRRFYVNQNNVKNPCLPAAKEAQYWVETASEIKNIATLDVSAIALDEFCRREVIGEIQILKMDVQGGEPHVLDGATERLSQGSILLIYTGLLFVPLYEGQAFFYEIASFLSRYGYTLFDIYNGAHSRDGNLKWADGLFLSPKKIRATQIEAKQPARKTSDEAPSFDQPAPSASDPVTNEDGRGRTTLVSSPSEAAARARTHKGESGLWDRNLRARRPAITDDGFDMPGFAGHYYMWPEEYALLSKYVDLTQGDYLEIGSMCGIIAMSFAVKYPGRNFYCVDAFCAGHATIAGNKQAFLQNLQDHSLKNVTLIEEDSRTAVPKIAHRFDIALIDANHAYEYVLADALNAWPLLAPG